MDYTLNIGFGNRVVATRLVAILVPGSSPMRRLKGEAKKAGKLANATHGRKCRSMLVMDTGHVLLSAVHPDTICQRFETVSCGLEDSENRVVASKIVAILMHDSAAMTRLKEEARSIGKLVDLTHGRKCRSMLVMDSGHLLLSIIHPDTLSNRYTTLSGSIDVLKKEV